MHTPRNETTAEPAHAATPGRAGVVDVAAAFRVVKSRCGLDAVDAAAIAGIVMYIVIIMVAAATDFFGFTR